MKSLIQKLIGITLILVLILYTNVSIANNDYTAEENQIQKNNQEQKEIEEKKQQIEQIKDETLKQVEKINLQITEYEGQIASLDEQINQTNAKITEAETNLKKAQEEFDKQEKLLEARLVESYESGETSYLDFLLSSDNIVDLISNYYLITEIATYDAELLDKIEKQKQEIANAKETLEQSKKDLNTQKASKQSITTQLQSSKNDKNKYVSQLNEEEKGLQERLEQIKKDNQSLDAKIQAKKAAIQAAQEALRKQQEQQAQANSSNGANNTGASSSSSGKSSSGFIKPVNSYVTTGMYYSSGAYHGAVDFGAAGVNGMPVYAVADGYVVSVEKWTTSYGNHILIAHANGLYTLYAHGQAGSITVSEGQNVKQGQQIMRVGSTGNSTGPHLHFEVRTSPGTYNCRKNPLAYLP